MDFSSVLISVKALGKEDPKIISEQKPFARLKYGSLNYLCSIVVSCRIKGWFFMVVIFIINQLATRCPEYTKKLIKGLMYKEVKSVMSKEEFEEHFSPPYNVGKKF